jgi:pimeloyl-ACP methyl ester carboxylesterase
MQSINIPKTKIKRLIICGIPCAEGAWKDLFPDKQGVEQKIVTFYEIFSENYRNKDFFDLVKGVQKVIKEFNPSVIMMHDIGVSFGLIAMMQLLRKKTELNARKIVIFNGAFRGFNVLRSTHPVRIQMMSYETFVREVARGGGEPDARLEKHYADLRHLYRQISYASITNLVSGLFVSREVNQVDLGCEILVIASRNDPYISFGCLQRIEKEFKNCKLVTSDYGHFPYAGNRDEIRALVSKFQSEPINNFIKSKL